MTRIALISGSLRRDSYNTRWLHQLAEGLDPSLEREVFDPQALRWPLFDQDSENEPQVWGQVMQCHQRLCACDGLIVTSPEYNGQMTPFLKNLVDWLSRVPYVDPLAANAFEARPVLLSSASTGWSGGALALVQVRALFAYVGAHVVGPTISLPYAGQAWTDFGYQLPPDTEVLASYALAQFTHLAQQFSPTRSHGASVGH